MHYAPLARSLDCFKSEHRYTRGKRQQPKAADARPKTLDDLTFCTMDDSMPKNPEKLAEQWRTLFREQHANLELVVRLLAGPGIPTDIVFADALERVKTTDVLQRFEYAFAVRAVVIATLARYRNTLAAEKHGVPSQAAEDAGLKLYMTDVPIEERLALVLSDVLQYPRSETAFLLRVTEAELEALNTRAQARLANAGPAFLEQLRQAYSTKRPKGSA
jgi:hypothetical protein